MVEEYRRKDEVLASMLADDPVQDALGVASAVQAMEYHSGDKKCDDFTGQKVSETGVLMTKGTKNALTDGDYIIKYNKGDMVGAYVKCDARTFKSVFRKVA